MSIESDEIYYTQQSNNPILSLTSIKDVQPEFEALSLQVLPQLHKELVSQIDLKVAANIPKKELNDKLKPIIRRMLEKHKNFTSHQKAYFENKLIDEVTGYGPLEPLLHDDSIDDILVNGHQSIYIDRGSFLEMTPLQFIDHEHVMRILNRMLGTVNRRIDEAVPFVDARLPDGSRVHAIIPPLAIDGAMISIRKFRKNSLTMNDLIKNETLTSQMAKMLDIAVKCRLNIVISGSIGSGKTTLLNALSQMIPDRERILTIEEIGELKLQKSHVVRLEARPANIEGKGMMSQRDLFKNALRMRPDRIIIGEVRGGEAFDMLQAMNVGNDGSLCTIHASSAQEVPTRLINMVALTGFNYSAEMISRQVATSVDLIIHMTRLSNGQRKVEQITEVMGLVGEGIQLQDLFHYYHHQKGSQVHGKFEANAIIPKLMKRAEQYGLDQSLREAIDGI